MKTLNHIAFANLAIALLFHTAITRGDDTGERNSGDRSGKCGRPEHSTPFSRIIVFGDSLSDSGNFYRMTGNTFPTSPPYWQGRFCNGPVWVEYLAQDLGMAGLEDNYAVGGATTGTENDSAPFGGVQNQIALYLSSHQGDPNALYILWAGHNDVGLALTTGNFDLSQVVINTVNNIQALWAAGARHILVVNIADLGKTPKTVSTDASVFVSWLVASTNERLADALHELAAEGIPTITLDSYAIVDTVVAHSAQFGFSDSTDMGISIYPADPAGYLFWDNIHPTTEFQHVFEQFAIRGLIDYFSPSRGRGIPPAHINALDGLVRAGKRH
jgi:phospholipase/lecithinase/hemolysin